MTSIKTALRENDGERLQRSGEAGKFKAASLRWRLQLRGESRPFRDEVWGLKKLAGALRKKERARKRYRAELAGRRV
jgi:hypothetical protein